MKYRKIKVFWSMAIIFSLLVLMVSACGNTAVVDNAGETEILDESNPEVILGELSEDHDHDAEDGDEEGHSHEDVEYMSIEDFVSLSETILEENFSKDNYEVYYEEDKGIVINVWDEAVTNGVLAIKDGDKSLIESWDLVRKSMSELSESCTESFQSSTGRVDEIAYVNVLNTKNKEDEFLSCGNGTIYFDMVDEYR